MHKAFKFRLLPTEEQEVILAKHFGCSGFIYNHFLSEKQKHYLENKETLKFNACQNMLIKQKKDEGYEWLKKVNSQCFVVSGWFSSFINYVPGSYPPSVIVHPLPPFAIEVVKNTLAADPGVLNVELPPWKVTVLLKLVAQRDVNKEL